MLLHVTAGNQVNELVVIRTVVKGKKKKTYKQTNKKTTTLIAAIFLRIPILT